MKLQERPGVELDGLDEKGVGPILRLLGGGASGAILLALGGGPLRTKDLTTQVSGFTPRTVYRYVDRLTAIGALEREVELGVPSKVVHNLTDPCGVDLHRHVQAYSKSSTSLKRLGNGTVVPQSWASLIRLADLWESGMYEQLNVAPCTATELASVGHNLSFHQVSRRVNLFMIGGLIQEFDGGGRRRHYELTDEARNATALIGAVGQWREHHAVPPGESGLTVLEAAELLRTALPLVLLPQHEGRNLRLSVVPIDPDSGEAAEIVWAEVGLGGAVVSCVEPNIIDGWGRGKVADWLGALLGTRSRVRAGGVNLLVRACIRGMHEGLWDPVEDRSSANGQQRVQASEVTEAGAGNLAQL